MIALDYIIIAALAYLVFVLFFKQQEKFEVQGYNTSTQDYSPATVTVTFSENYIAHNLNKILYEFTMELERKLRQSATITPTIKIKEEEFNQTTLVRRGPIIEKVIKKLNNMFNIDLAVIELDKVYGIKEAYGPGYIYLLFNVKITPEYKKYVKNSKKVLKKDLNLQIYNKIFLALDVRYNVYQLRLYDIESIDANGDIGIDPNTEENENLKNPVEDNLSLNETQTKQQAEEYISQNHSSQEGKCITKNGIDKSISYDVECKLQGGIWEKA